MSELILKEESYKIIGACFEVYNQKGFGFTEAVYQECLEIEFQLQKIPFISQPKVELDYKGRTLKQFFIPDFVCFDKIIVEIKALPCLVKENIAQTLNYLNATKFELAWLINFGQTNGLERKRIINDRNNSIKLRNEIESWNFQ
ncbi:MAG: GxxExxY protein [Pyrinomonadaceae bacterium]|nr:GxxExxY protein [Pyrinomonadaceae bacterium]